MTFVQSINPDRQVSVSGADVAAGAAHMYEWLGRSGAFPEFVIHDIEEELYRQTPGAQVQEVWFTAEPHLKTSAARDGDGSGAVVTGLSVIFFVTVRIGMSDGIVWKLDVQHGYHASDIHQSEHRKLRIDFVITAHFKES